MMCAFGLCGAFPQAKLTMHRPNTKSSASDPLSTEQARALGKTGA